MKPKCEYLPPEILSLHQFVCWRTEDRGGKKPTKIPVAPWRTGDLRPVDATDPANWTDFETACRWAEKLNMGVGISLKEEGGIVGIDLDEVIDEKGKIHPFAFDLVTRANTYAEITPSGRGIRILGLGILPSPIRHDGDVKIEVYDRKRFFTITGEKIAITPKKLQNIQDILDELVERFRAFPRIEREPSDEGMDILKVAEKVIPALKKRGKQLQGPHPVHGSTTGMNFSINPEKGVWFCYRHWIGGGPLSLLGMLEGIITCEDLMVSGGRIPKEKFSSVVEIAREKGFIREERRKPCIKVKLTDEGGRVFWMKVEKEDNRFHVTITGRDGETLWEDLRKLQFWKSEQTRRAIFKKICEKIPGLKYERFEEACMEITKAEESGSFAWEPKEAEGEKVRVEYVPCVITDEFIAEEVWNPKEEKAGFAMRRFGSEEIEYVDEIEHNGKVYRPLITPALKKGLIILPERAEKSTFSEVWNEACEMVFRFYDCENESRDEVRLLIACCISSWFLDRYNIQIPGMGAFAPIIALRGPPGHGKDRLLNALRLISYRPFHDVSTKRTPSLYRPMDEWRGTLCLSEMDVKGTDETSDLIHYLNCRCYGVPISRQDPNNPRISQAFHNFGLTIVTQRRPWEDPATESRTLPFYCEKTVKEIPTVELDEWIERGKNLQNKLLFLRLMHWEKVKIDKAARISGIKDHRLTSAVLPLLSLGKFEPALLENFTSVLQRIEKRRREVKAMSREGVIVNRLYDLWKEDLIGVHNGIEYMGKEREGEEIIPLQTRDLAEELNWSTKEVKKVINSLQLHPSTENLPRHIYVGSRSYRPIWISRDRLLKRFLDYVPEYEPPMEDDMRNLADTVKMRDIRDMRDESTMGDGVEKNHDTVKMRDIRDMRDEHRESVSEKLWSIIQEMAGPSLGLLIDKRRLRTRAEEAGIDGETLDGFLNEMVKFGRLLDRGGALEVIR